MRRGGGEKIGYGKRRDEKMRRWGDEKMRRWEGEKMRRCEGEKIG